jgi:hypothetical protein
MSNPVIFAQQLAEVVRRLRELGVPDDDPQLSIKIDNVLQTVLGGAVAQRASQINIDLPDLEDNVQADINPDNVMAMSAIYFSAQLEELKFFAVADKVAEQFQTGVIPTSRSMGGEAIYRYIRDATLRLSEAERRGMYARAFGFAQGSVDEPMPNREFSDVWIRFLSSVSVLQREWDANIRKSLTQEQVFKNARDLTVNVSLHGYGMAHFAAVEMQDLIKNLLKMLSYGDVLQAYGVNDVWQLVERVSGLYLGGSANSVRQRTLARSGANIIQWLARKRELSQPSIGNGLFLNLGFQTTASGIILTGANGQPIPLDPDAQSLAADVERWLAVTGTDDTSVEKYSEPVSMSQQPTIPNLSLQAIPDVLSGVSGKANGLSGVMQGIQNLAPQIGKA